MKLQEWIDNKINELKEQNKYREVTFKTTKLVKMSRHATQESFIFGVTDDSVKLDTEVKDVIRENLPITYNSDEYVDAVKITLEVLKPRKRKTEREYYYVQFA